MNVGASPKPRPRRRAGGLAYLLIGFGLVRGVKGQDELAYARP